MFCNKLLFQWHLVDSALCTFCQEDYETMEHLFFLCPKVKIFLSRIQAWFESQTNTEIDITQQELFFCNHNDNLLNILFLILKQYIYNRRCFNGELSLTTFKAGVMEIVSFERYEAFKDKRFKPFVRKWSRLFE